jgi:hypothetical protein
MQRPYTDYLPREFFAEYIPLTRSTRGVIPAAVGLRYPLGEILVEARVGISLSRIDGSMY